MRLITLSLVFGISLASAATDARFGLVGTGGKAFAQKLGLTYYALEGNYPGSGNVFSSVNPANDPAAGYKVLRKVAKLNVRNDTLGQANSQFEAAFGAFANSLAVWHSTHSGSKPVFSWFTPNASVLAAAESLQIITTIRREKTLVPAVTGTVWEIGNEPNLFPAIPPATYAAIFTRYYKIIKGEDPAAKVAMGPVFVRETSMDLLQRMQEVQTQSLIAKGLGQPGQPVFDSVNKDLWLTYSARTLSMGTVDYFGQVLAAMDTSVKPDVISLHVYPFEDRLPVLGEDQVKRVLDSLADTLTARVQKRGGSPKIWITEFGNINSGYSAEQATALASSLIDVFSAGTRYQNWFYYKGTGVDEQLAGLNGIPAPLTRLAVDGSFEPANGNFTCGRLNAIGQMYYLRANGVECLDAAAGFPTANSLWGFSDVISPHNLRVRLGKAEVDTVRVSVVAAGGTLTEGTHFTFAPSTLSFAPGDTSKTFTIIWKTSPAAGNTIVFKLRDIVNGRLSADTTHTVTLTGFCCSVLPSGPAGLTARLNFNTAALLISAIKDADITVRILDASGKTHGSLSQKIAAGHNSINLRAGVRTGTLPAGLYHVEVIGPGFKQVFSLPWLNP